ncbi:MAG: hypothetical protein ABIN05_05350 [candidate division WOR-3 bacterium]
MKKLLLIIIFPFLIFSQVQKEVLLDVGKSLIVPGYGLWSIDKKINSVPFIASEVILLPLFSYLAINSKQTNEDALNFASYVLSKNVSNYPENLLTKMEFYTSYKEYNTKIITKARTLYPDDYDKQLDYINKNIVPDSLGWEFFSDSARLFYSDLRRGSRELKQLSYYTAMVISLNHIISGIYTYFVSSEKRKVNFESKVDFNGLKFTIGVKF